ncbi:MAG: NAD(P)-dependent oxidoreductase [Acetobacteraceae bacterium]|nr:NAD(P)-dependent oxidoreductase [Acetobacteraceae bacterium]
MTVVPARPVLLTGASGALGRMLAAALGAEGWTLRLTDIAPFPDPLPQGARFIRADLDDGMALLRLAEGCGAILHFGGVSVEQPWEAVAGPNLRGLFHVYEAARREGARVVFASSNHAIGFHERPQGNERLAADCAFRPDGYYGLSKAYGELMGRLYWDKHGVENVNLRIGSCVARPSNNRMLSTWLSYPDLARLCMAAVTAPRAGHCVIWACSNNGASFWGEDHRDRIGWQPRDSADAFRAELAGKNLGDAVEERYQGGPYCSMDYSRAAPSPRDAFALE